MDWQTPSFEEIDMSAEIGAYSPDMPGEQPEPRFVHDADASSERAD
jgi:coenzyme PQQ precursor peptide PqqA